MCVDWSPTEVEDANAFDHSAVILISVVPAMGQDKSSSLDPAGVRGVRMLMREDADLFAKGGKNDTLFDWSSVGIERPAETIDVAQMRAAFESNILDAERRFAHPVIVRGTLHSVVRGSDQQIVVRFAEGEATDSQRRALSKLGGTDPGDVIGGVTGGLMHGGAQADLANGNEDLAASWKPRQKIELLCQGAANTGMALLLKNCVPLAAVVTNAERIADQQAELLLARKPLEV
jgi:hypothetical protein